MGEFGVILFSHGSVLCGSEAAVEAHAERLRCDHGIENVEVGFLNYSRPTFSEAVHRLVDRGVTEVRVVPYFLVAGKFVSVDLPRAISEASLQFPRLKFTVANALDDDQRLEAALHQLALDAIPLDQAAAIKKTVADPCRMSDACPLYATDACPGSAGSYAS